MRYPKLVPAAMCKTDITLVLDQEGLDHYGEPLPAFTYTGKCNYQDSAKTILTTEKKLVQLNGKALFDGDICPSLSVISGGSATLLGATRGILEGRKARNPDGTVNYTEVLLT